MYTDEILSLARRINEAVGQSPPTDPAEIENLAAEFNAEIDALQHKIIARNGGAADGLAWLAAERSKVNWFAGLGL